MTLSALGIFSAAGAGGVVALSDYELIETQILGSDTSSITFSSLATYASTYKHLQLRIASRETRTGNSGEAKIRLNGDTGANYTGHSLFGNGSSVSSGFDGSGQTSAWAYYVPSASIASNIFGGAVIDILDAYSTTKNKVFRSLSGFTGASSVILLKSGMRISTESTTSITILPQSGNFLTGSRFSLYGVK